MEKYLNYLLTDIAAAAASVPVLTFEDADEGPSFIPLDEEEKMARREILGEWIGLRQEWFPPAARMNDEQLARLLEAVMQCLDVYNFIPHFPAGLPDRRRYEVLVAQLGKEVPVLMHNAWQIDFCEYEPRTCPFGETFCQCKVYEQWLTRAEEEEEELYGELSEKPLLPGLFFSHEEGEDYDDEEYDDEEYDDEFFFEEEGSYYDEEYDYDDDDGFDDDDEDEGNFLSGFSGPEPGPDDGGRWN